ncbi:MAG TPA: hypothetical protein VLA95_04875 [Gemmatimonadales bacterium]|nr:hypothetical protein [Gemmatimonadales bacterium]
MRRPACPPVSTSAAAAECTSVPFTRNRTRSPARSIRSVLLAFPAASAFTTAGCSAQAAVTLAVVAPVRVLIRNFPSPRTRK